MEECMVVRRFIPVLVLMIVICLPAFGGQVRVFEGPVNIQIPNDTQSIEGWVADAMIEIPEHMTIFDVDVGIIFSNTKFCDLQIFLKSPADTQVLLELCDTFTENFDGHDYSGIIFDDEANTGIDESDPIFVRRFRPKESLAVFDGQDAFGHWCLHIHNAYCADTGWLGAGKLFIAVPEPLSASFLILGGVLVRLRRSRKNSENFNDC
jgi:subtilisin-like proprotein convertase family protein